MDTEDIKILLYVIGVGFIIFLLIRFGSKPKKCTVCEGDTQSVYMDENHNPTPLCKNHLTDRWKKDVTASQVKMIMIEPDFEFYPYGYTYGTVDILVAEWSYDKETQDHISAILDGIYEKLCASCRSEATVAYFKKDDYPVPELIEIKAMPTYLCKSCSVKNVEPLMRNSVKELVEGVMAPTKERGIYSVQGY